MKNAAPRWYRDSKEKLGSYLELENVRGGSFLDECTAADSIAGALKDASVLISRNR